MLEELAVAVAVGPRILTTAHTYPDRVVELHFYRCELKGEPRPLLGQELRWVRREDLRGLNFPPADDELIAKLTNQ
jgi:8-oxo-dGTP diphosphatase